MSLLLSGLNFSSFDIKNRIVMPPMDMYEIEVVDGQINQFHLTHYGARALGGVGLIIVQATAINENAKIADNDIGLWSDMQIKGHKELVNLCHYFGSKIAIQLNHSGRKNSCINAIGKAPSNITFSEKFSKIHVLSKEEIIQIEEEFVKSAKRAKEAGYDAIELHGAHGYLLSSFLSPLSNKREDEYGGSFENRIRLLCDIVKRIKKEVGIALFVRISATEWQEDGWNLEDSKKLALILEELGIDMLDVSAGGNINKPSLMPHIAPLYQAPYAKALKEILNIPVACVGLINSASEGEALLLGEVCDLVCYGRKLLQNPNFANEAAVVLNEREKIMPNYSRAYL
ncbi:oxidoreductase [Campylobacter insulaenigrae]|uniref:oxidoreductase n=1 Tax=Campylobacter insulaenigrae TaxID=260714 RepID=UPI002152B3C4|nr:tRNA-dihydrouridine synthase [Campylobacter insulaenigrae]MCR6587435.1 tRNA-dihydrouridine synthase [Campylobacter insulaenigrae]